MAHHNMAVFRIMLSVVYFVLFSTVANSDVQKAAEDFLAKFNKQAPVEANKLKKACWNYETDISDGTETRRKAAVAGFSEFMLDSSKAAGTLDSKRVSEGLRRQLFLIQDVPVLKNKMKLRKLAQVSGEMTRIYTEAKTTDQVTGKRNLSLIPVLENILAHSRNYDELLFAWKGWRDVTGPALVLSYKRYVELSKEAVQNSGFQGMSDYWRSQYEGEDLEALVESLWSDLKPLYLELHAYVRFKLARVYPQVRERDPIPANVLGSMWSQDWSNLYSLVEPYAGKSSLNVNESLQKRNYSVEDVVHMAESFYASLQMPKLPKTFYSLSLFDKPGDREVVCDTSEWDFFSTSDEGECDMRIKQCATVSTKWLVSTHQQLAHAYYMLSYCDQPFMFRDGANPAFPEGIGGAMSLSVTTPYYLKKVGLLEGYSEDNETVINAMMQNALRHIAFLPFGYLLHQWTRGVYEQNTKEYNTKWWQLRAVHQGVNSPVLRSEDYFDPGAYYHTFSDTSSIRYFLGTILQFQFHKALCDAAGATYPLHECSIYNSTAAGEKIKAMFKTGKSKPWRDVLQEMTGQRKFDAGPLLEYYKPLHLWLREQRCVTNYTIGWEEHPGPQYNPCEMETFSTVSTAYSGANARVTSCTGTFLWIVFVCFMFLR